MGTYGLEQAIEMWRVSTLTAEQAIGQLLQFIREDRERMNEIERRLKKIERREARGDFVVSLQSNEGREASSAARRTLDE